MCARHNHDASVWIDVNLCWLCSWEVWRVSVCETVQSNLHVLYMFCCEQNSPSQALINFARLQKKLSNSMTQFYMGMVSPTCS